MVKSGVTITWNRVDGSERARFDNIEDALIFAEAVIKEQKRIKQKWEKDAGV